MSLKKLNDEIKTCTYCPRLVRWREEVAVTKRAAYAEQDYHGAPIIGFGDPKAKIIIVGLAPGAHGANRTGRVFTGDRSGEWLYRALHKAKLANQSHSEHLRDGLKLKNAYITLIVRCVPPQNKPTTEERDQCLPYFVTELQKLKEARVLMALGGFALDGILRALARAGHTVKPKPKFKHGSHFALGPYTILASMHPSQQNTFTKRLTEPMFDKVFQTAKELATGKNS